MNKLLRLLTFAALIHVVSAAEKPNVVFILADDLGVMDMSGEGSTFHETPHIDRIAREGVRFTRGYATCQVCSPSRASIMSGKYPARLDITDWINSNGGGQPEKWKRNTSHLPASHHLQLPLEEVTIAEALKEAGYATFFAGKWHLGGEGFYPEDQGFDINQGGHERGSPPGGFFSPYKNPKLQDGPAGESLPVRLGQETAKFIEASKDKPFLAVLNFYSVHGPDQTTVELYEKYRAKAQKLPEVKERFLNDVRIPVRQVQDNPIYAGMMESMDDAVGMVLKKLDALGLADNTMVIFTSDNGGVSAGDAFSTSNLPLRGGKGIEYEGGIREPYYIRWPARAKPDTNSTPVTGTDFYPTILEACGLPLRPKQHVDGVSLVPLLEGKSIPKRPLFWHYPHYSNQGGEPVSMIMDGDWKLIEDIEDGSLRLYHVAKDIGEQNDLSKVNAERTQMMAKQLNAWKKEVGAGTMAENPKYDPAKFEATQKLNHTRKKDQLETFHRNLVHPPSPLTPGEPVTYRSSAFKPGKKSVSAPAPKVEKPNVLLISVDDLNDWCGCLGGHPQAQTPNIDRLAKRGTLFTNAHCQSPVCNPSRASMMTGRYPHSTGIYFLSPDLAEAPALKGVPTMPQYFQKEGYQTLAVGKIFHGGDRRFFQEYGGNNGGFGPRPKKKISQPHGHPLWDWGVYPEKDEDMPDHKAAKWAVEKLKRKYDKPFFMGVGFYRPHVPMYAPQKWFDKFPIEKVKLPEVLLTDRSDISDYAINITNLEHVSPTHEWVSSSGKWKSAVQAYLASVAFADHCVGKVLDALAAGPHAENTIVVLFSDHGFHLGEKEKWAKRSLWGDGTRVPVIVSAPGFPAGRNCHQPVELLDIFPTLIDLAKIKKDKSQQGQSMVSLLRNPEANWPYPAITSFGPGNYSVKTRRYRYIQYLDGSRELYDHDIDKNEWYNFAGESLWKNQAEKMAAMIPKEQHELLPGNSTGHQSYTASNEKAGL